MITTPSCEPTVEPSQLLQKYNTNYEKVADRLTVIIERAKKLLQGAFENYQIDPRYYYAFIERKYLVEPLPRENRKSCSSCQYRSLGHKYTITNTSKVSITVSDLLIHNIKEHLSFLDASAEDILSVIDAESDQSDEDSLILKTEAPKMFCCWLDKND